MGRKKIEETYPYTIGTNTVITCPKIKIEENVRIGNNVLIDVSERIDIGRKSIIGDNSIIRGRDIKIGREFYADHHSEIGGGSCKEKTSKLEIGYWFHLGSYTMINTAMPVVIGNECGFGRNTNIYTHGSYQNILDGFPVVFKPVKIGNNVWLPNATVMPGVCIGDNVVVGVGSIITKDLPSGCLALGTPAKVVKEMYFPYSVDKRSELMNILHHYKYKIELQETHFDYKNATIDFQNKTINGNADADTEKLRDRLRRWGIRFKVDIKNGKYVPWFE